MIERKRRKLVRRKGPTRHRLAAPREAHEMIPDREHIALCVQSRSQLVPRAGAIEAVAQIVGAIEQQLDRPPRHGARKLRRHRHIVILQPPPESAASPHLMHDDAVRIDCEHVRHQLAPTLGPLAVAPEFVSAVPEQAGEAGWLQRRMGDEWIMVARRHPLRCARQRGGGISPAVERLLRSRVERRTRLRRIGRA